MRELTAQSPIDGASVVNMSPALGEELDFAPYLSGVVVSEIKRGTFASGNRLRAGDLITEINGTAVTSTRQLESLLLTEQGTEDWKIRIDRQGRIGFLPIRYVPAVER